MEDWKTVEANSESECFAQVKKLHPHAFASNWFVEEKNCDYYVDKEIKGGYKPFGGISLCEFGKLHKILNLLGHLQKVLGIAYI